MTNTPPPGWYQNAHGMVQWWDGSQWGALHQAELASDTAREWAGKGAGLITGAAGGLAIFLLTLAWRACGPAPLGPKTTHVHVWPFEPSTYSHPVEGQLYCVPAFGGDGTMTGLVLALIWVVVCFVVGAVRDARKKAIAKRLITTRLFGGSPPA